jgi:diguanylate cyclase (GGDEF)-like protein
LLVCGWAHVLVSAESLTGTYQPGLAALSGFLAVLVSYATLDLAGRVATARRYARAAWLAYGSLAIGTGIWCVHFVAMLAYRLPVAVRYDVHTVLAALCAAVITAALALTVVSSMQPRPLVVMAGGALIGLGIAGMQYIGMSSMRLHATSVYSPVLVALSCVMAVVVATGGLHLAFRVRSELHAFTRLKLAGACVLGAVIPLMQYCSTAAVTFVPVPGRPDFTHAFDISPLRLATIVAVTCLVLAFAVISSYADRRWSEQVRELDRRQRSLTAAEGRSSKREQRIAAISRVARESERLSYDERAKAILAIATASLRPGQPALGMLTHLDRGTIVVDTVETAFGAPEDFTRIVHVVRPGSTFAAAGTLHAQLEYAGSSMAWNQLDGEWAIADRFLQADCGVHAVIGAPVHIGARTHFVIVGLLASNADDPFFEEDLAFIDVVAAFLANGYQRQLQADRLAYQMEHDAITGLANRVQLRRAASVCLAEHDNFALAVLNLDRFREINLAHGQLIGDELLVEVATNLAAVDDRDLVSRRNGDEFAILLRGVTEADVAERTARYVDVFSTPFNTGDRDGTRLLSVTSSFGVSLHPRDGNTVEALMIRAETALDAAKSRGGTNVLIFDARMEEMLRAKWLDRSEITRALSNQEFLLYYQPTFDLESRAIIGAEALIRWNHPSRGLVMPGEFIPYAERNGLIGLISLWVFERLLRDIRSVTLPAGIRLYMNLAAQQLDDPAFAEVVLERLAGDAGLARQLGFELTETTAMLNVRSSIFALESFRRTGISIAIDDFGTGFSSLSYLKHLPADVIKIDQSFVAGIPFDRADATLADTFIWLANAFDFVTLAEGIEREEQVTWLKEHGCRLGQGFLMSPAVPFETFLGQLTANAPSTITR